MKKLAAYLSAIVLAVSLVGSANAIGYFDAPQFPGIAAPNPALVPQGLEFLGCMIARVEYSTTPVQVTTGAGLIYEINVSSGLTTSAFAIGYDSASILGLGVYQVNTPANKAVTPRVYTSAAGVAAPTVAGLGTWVGVGGGGPHQFINGLVVSNSDPGSITQVCWRPGQPTQGQ